MKKSDKISTFIFYFSLFAFIIGFNFQDNPPSGWYQQFLPDIGGRQISDIFFLDSLIGWAVTAYVDLDDTAYVLKTTNGGDNWQIAHIRTGGVGFKRIYFLNSQIGFSSGANDFGGYSGLSKSTDGGFNWVSLNVPDPFVQFNDMSVHNEDTIWLVASSNPTGGVFRTTNGGINWTQQINLGSQNPTNIYFYDKYTGYTAQNILYKTTNGGINWFQISGGGFGDMYFLNGITGWKCYGPIQKTTNGGLNWQTLPLPPKGGSIVLSRVNRMHVLNEDTIWGVGSVGIINSVGRGLINITTDGGITWGYQVPDTSINIFQYQHIQFIDKSRGWAYSGSTGLHTVTGGDTIIYLNVEQINNQIPTGFELFQNYPNPFNPSTKIKFKTKNINHIKLVVFDITGKVIAVLVNEKLNSGGYIYEFISDSISSGVYFYSLIVEGLIIDTKKMLFIK